MGVFDHILKSDQTLIKNEAALDYEFVPKLLPYREKEQKYLATCISPLLSARTGRNLLIHGPPGIGKTAATKHVLRDLEDHTEEINIVFINCWKFNTTHKIACETCEQVGYKFYQNKKTTEIFSIVASIINKKSAVFVFDEIDKVEEFDFLYFLLEEIFKKSIFLITNYKSFLLELDERIKSRLIPELIEFRQYNEKETHDILKQRLDYAFYPNVWDEDAFRLVARKSFELKDIRSGLFLLHESAVLCEERSQKRITQQYVADAIKKLEDFTIKNSAELEEDTKKILEIVKQHSGKKIGDLYRVYEKEGGKISYKTFQRKIAALDEGRFISLTRETGAKGNTTIVNRKLTDF